jgi:NAD-dependent deacetylase
MAEENDVFLEKFTILTNALTHSHSTVAFTGAGVSTLSGIPDFRSAGGVYSSQWQGYDVEEVLSISFFNKRPDLFYKWGTEFLYNLEQSEPSIIHKVLAELERKGYLDGLFTQNIDMLHTKAGSKKCWEIHGSAAHHYCTKCAAAYSYERIAPVVRKGEVPLCTACGAVIRPDIVFYGEGLGADNLGRAVQMFSEAKLCIVFGSSLVVQPAASLPAYTLEGGGEIAIVNAQRTSYDSAALALFKDLAQVGEALQTWVQTMPAKKALASKS